MEVLNAAGVVSPLSSTLHRSDKKPESRKQLSLPKFPEVPTFQDAQKKISGGLAALSAVLSSAGLAKALTYEEALSMGGGGGESSSSFDPNGFVDGIVKFGTENPLVVGGGALAFAVPLILSQILGGKTQKFGVEIAKNAYLKLSEDADAQLLDIREGKEFKESGSPDLRGIKKKSVSIAYRGEDKPGFLKKLALKFKDPANTTLFILDKFNGNSELVAELVTVNGFKAAYAIRDGAEGPRGWKNSGLPWSPPKKSVDFGDLREAISGAFGDGADGLPVLGLAAATGLGILAFSEIETVLQLLGSAAIIQFATKKLLFAEDRKVTLKQIDEFLNTKVAPKELADEIKMIGKALLPVSVNGKASLPAPVEETQAPPPPVEEIPAAPTVVAAVAEPPNQETNSVPKAEAGPESHSAVPRPLSPYPYYPDLKPPSSPAPSQP